VKDSQALEILEKVLSFAGADEVTATLSGGSGAVTRFADNAITQNIGRTDHVLAVSCAYGSRHASATTNRLLDEALEAVVERAEAAARVSPPDPEYMPPVEATEAAKYPTVESWFEETAKFSPEARAEGIAWAAKEVGSRGFRLSGAFTTSDSFFALANSAGLRAFHRSTMAEIHATVLGETGSGWSQKIDNNADDVHVEQVTFEALEIAAKAQNPVDTEPGKYTVILRPVAVVEMLPHYMICDAKATDEDRTFLRGKLGKKVCGDNITIRSDPTHPRCPGMPFQYDGLVSPSLCWVRNGVLESLATSRYWGKKTGRKPTGYPTNVIMDGGDTTLDQMIASTEEGFLVTRFWYIRYVDPMECLLTGMTRDGLFLIRDGRIDRPIKNLRFNESVPGVLGRVEALGPSERAEWGFVPPLKIRDFSFTSTTKF
jgi:predicted Zn-dependent protease